MTPASTVRGLGCLVLFLLPFAGIGVFTAIQALQRAAAGNWKEALFLGLFGLTFGAVGIGGIAAALAGTRKLKEQSALESRYPDRPWLWRQDWASGRIMDTGRRTVVFAWIFTIFWNLVSLPAGYFGLRTALKEGEYIGFLGLLFPTVGAGLLVGPFVPRPGFASMGPRGSSFRPSPAWLVALWQEPSAFRAACRHRETSSSPSAASTSQRAEAARAVRPMRTSSGRRSAECRALLRATQPAWSPTCRSPSGFPPTSAPATGAIPRTRWYGSFGCRLKCPV
jgi:hypothetical protein